MKKITTAIALIGFMVSPSSLNFDSLVSQKITVTNGSKDSAHYEVYMDDMEGYFALMPSQFDLMPSEVKEITVALESGPPGSIATNLSIVAKSASSENVSFQTGIKVPVSASKNSSGNFTAFIGGFANGVKEHWLMAIVAILLIGSVPFLLRHLRRRSD